MRKVKSGPRVEARNAIRAGASAKITGKKNSKLLATAKAYECKYKKQCIIGAYSIPAGFTCPGAGGCLNTCYARHGNFKFIGVAKRLWINWLALGKSKQSATVTLLNAIRAWYYENHKPYPCTYLLRIHDAGDFFAQFYLDAWTQAIKTFNAESAPEHDVIFYGYTKSLHLNFSEFLSLPNVRFVQSLDGKYRPNWDHAVAAIVPKDSPITGSWVDANGDPSIQDLAVIDGSRRIALTYHGSGSGNWFNTTQEIDQGLESSDLIQIGVRQ
tara:strand:+ start:152 stop:961 length:810 start_codon:yes stop_codon:yes gene_type:complete